MEERPSTALDFFILHDVQPRKVSKFQKRELAHPAFDPGLPGADFPLGFHSHELSVDASRSLRLISCLRLRASIYFKSHPQGDRGGRGRRSGDSDYLRSALDAEQRGVGRINQCRFF